MTEGLHFHFSLSCIGEGNGSPLQCSCLENPRDGGAWWAAVYGVTQSWTQLKQLSSSSSICLKIFEWFSSVQLLSRIRLFRPHESQHARLLCAWDSPGKNTGVGCHAFLQGIFPIQGSNPHLLCLLCWQAGYFYH